MNNNNRKFPRYATSEETIYYSKEADSERVHYMGTITNTSQGGIGMRVQFPHQPFDELWLEGLEGYNSAQAAQVRWVKNIGPESYELGVQLKQNQTS